MCRNANFAPQVEVNMKSKINNGFEFSEEKWLVTLLSMGSHSIIVVEGINNDGSLFVGQYDVKPTNIYQHSCTGLPAKAGMEVRVHEFSYYNDAIIEKSRQASNCWNWLVEYDKIQSMLEAIYQEKGVQLPFVLYGNSSILETQKAHNCASWCLEKLGVAGIKNTASWLDYLVASPDRTLGTKVAIGGGLLATGLLIWKACSTSSSSSENPPSPQP